MPKQSGFLRPIISSFLFVICIIGWIILAPRGIGGQTTYIIVVGNSMEPRFHNNDLVLVQNANDYIANDIVAYKHPDLGIVFHRIIRIEDNHYIFKGDNNTWEDSYHPNSKELIGKLWIHLPGLGKILRNLRTPLGFSSITIVFLLLLVWIFVADSVKISDKPQLEQVENYNRSKNTDDGDKDHNMDNKSTDSVYLIASVGFIAVILAIVSFSQPLEISSSDNYPFTHQGHFEYFSAVPEDIYDNNMLQSGDPIYRQINDSFNVIFNYAIKTEQPLVKINGTYRMLAIIKEASGWERSIDLIQPSLVNVNKFTSTATVDLSQIQSLIDNFEMQTGVSNNRYTLVIQPQIDINGKINGRNIHDNFNPQLRFSFDDQKLVLLEDNDQTLDALNPIKESLSPGKRNTPNSIPILGLKLNVLAARMISIFTLVGTIAIFLWVLYKNIFQLKSTK